MIALHATRAFQNKLLYYDYMKKFLAREILIGAGGHAHSCIDVIEQNGIFNIADLSVTTGMIIILISSFKRKS